jgi:hypothetical protein
MEGMSDIMLIGLFLVFTIALLALGEVAYALITRREVEIDLRALGLRFFLRSSK